MGYYRVRYEPNVREFLETHSHAEEVRLAVAVLERGAALAGTAVVGDADGSSFLKLDSGRVLWWRFAGVDRSVLVIEEVTEKGH